MQQSMIDPSEAQWEKAAAKITYLGEQTKPIATVVFHTAGCDLVMKDFAPLHSAHELYTNDELPYTRFFIVTPYEFSEILRSVPPVLSDPALFRGGDFLSFTILRKGAAGTEGREFKIGRAAGKSFFQAILNALGKDNDAGKQILQKQFANMFPQ